MLSIIHHEWRSCGNGNVDGYISTTPRRPIEIFILVPRMPTSTCFDDDCFGSPFPDREFGCLRQSRRGGQLHEMQEAVRLKTEKSGTPHRARKSRQ